jgi:hypothetical protein
MPNLFRVACVIAVVIASLVCASPTAILAQDEERGAVEVVIRNSTFVYQARILRVDEQAVIVVRNADTIQHGFTSAAIAEFDARVETDGVVTYGKGIKGLYLDSGQEVRIRFTPTRPVKMSFRCDLHPAMTGEIVFLSVGAT